MALVAPSLTSAMPITRVNRSAVNGVVNAVTGRNKDNNAPVPVEETQETQGTQAPLEELEVPTELPQLRYYVSEKSAPIEDPDPVPCPRNTEYEEDSQPVSVPPVLDEPIDWEAKWDEVGQHVQSGDWEGLQNLLAVCRSIPHEEAAQLAQYIQGVIEEEYI